MKSQNTLLFGREVRIGRTLPGSVTRVWDYLTRAELLERWFAAGEIGALGSRIHMTQTLEAAPWKKEGYMCGIVVECYAPYRLSYTLKEVTDGLPEDEVEDSLVEFSLRQTGPDVQLEIAHSRLGREELRWVHAEWSARLDFLIEDLADPRGGGPRRTIRAPRSQSMIRAV